jgi:hypothetical protein
MLAKRLATILPPLTLEEALETTKIHSIVGLLAPGQALVTRPPFRAPHCWMGLMNTQSKFIAAARAKCSFHPENGPVSSGNRLYKIIMPADYSTAAPPCSPKFRLSITMSFSPD